MQKPLENNSKLLYEKNERICELKSLDDIKKLIAIKGLKLNLHCLMIFGSYYFLQKTSRILKYFTIMTGAACLIQNVGFVVLTSFISRRLCKFMEFSDKEDSTILFQSFKKNGKYLAKLSNIQIERIDEININFSHILGNQEEDFNYKEDNQNPKFYQGCLLQLKFLDEKTKRQRSICLPIIPIFFSVKNIETLKRVCSGLQNSFEQK
eukprot:TRINITY_DN3558_c0_g1_i1.p2 TRINITY_DN3558_c0_g1~~TRINITY_DN3558_c0_g1_i1.p2  ORF type:complete len:208 (-),score=31.19 TRINITY_DN3558_c0_g1_i1:79-702(-)